MSQIETWGLVALITCGLLILAMMVSLVLGYLAKYKAERRERAAFKRYANRLPANDPLLQRDPREPFDEGE